MKCWAITGPMGAGKSLFSAALVNLGAALIDGDLLGHQTLENPEVLDELVAYFGSDIMSDGRVNRPFLGKVVFNNPVALQRLNAITHPRICALAREKLQELASENNHPLAVFEAAVYFLFSEPPQCDLVITITAPEKLRIQRLINSRGLSLADTQMRVKSQNFLKKHWETADLVLHNDGTPDNLALKAHNLLTAHQLIAGDNGPGRESTP